MDKGIIEDVARNVARNALTVIDLTNKSVAIYLDQGPFDETVAKGVAISPFSLATGLVAIGAHFCGLDEEETVELLTKLAEDGVFRTAKKEPVKFAVVANTPHITVEEAVVWGDAIATLGGELKESAFADIVIILGADAAGVGGMRKLNPAAKIVAVLPKVDRKLREAVCSAGAHHAYYSMETPEGIRFILEDVLREN